MKRTLVVALAFVVAACGSGIDSADNDQYGMPDAPDPCAGTPHEDPEDRRTTRWKHVVDHPEFDDLWMGFSRTVDMKEALALAGPPLRIRGIVVVYPWTESTYLKAQWALPGNETLEAVYARIRAALVRDFEMEARHRKDPVVLGGARRVATGDIPVGAFRLAGPPDELARFVRHHRCLVHGLRLGTAGRAPMSKEASPQ